MKKVLIFDGENERFYEPLLNLEEAKDLEEAEEEVEETAVDELLER